MKTINAILAVMFLAGILASAGCNSSTTTTNPQKTIVKTGEGNVQIESEGTAIDSWCPVGGKWKYSANVEQGQATGEWKVIGLETSGKYAGLCHVLYTVNQGGQKMEIEYWFTEDGKSGYMQMDVNGQKIVQEWSSQ